MPGLGGQRAGSGVEIEVIFVGQKMPYEIGPATVAVPGVPAGAHHLWRTWGRLRWAEVVEPGLEASYGTPFPETHARLLPRVAAAMAVGDGSIVYRRADGSYLQAGDPLRHPDHHRAYELLISDPTSFYHGAYADALVRAVADGGALEQAGSGRLLGDRVRRRARSGWTASPCTPAVMILTTCSARMAAVSRAVPGDPRTDPASARGLVEALRAPDQRTETTNIVAVDDQGDGCAITTSLGLGSGVWVDGYGVHLNSMIGEGELIRGLSEPGVRMGSMMSPLVALDDRATVRGDRRRRGRQPDPAGPGPVACCGCSAARRRRQRSTHRG